MAETVYVVEKHDSNYDGRSKSRIARGADTAMRVAESMRDEHHGDEWSLRTRERDGLARVTFHPDDGATGWVSVTEKPLVE